MQAPVEPGFSIGRSSVAGSEVNIQVLCIFPAVTDLPPDNKINTQNKIKG